MLQRARWAIDDESGNTKWDNENGRLFTIDSKNYNDFKNNYYKSLDKKGNTKYNGTRKRFNSTNDPMADVMGSAEKSHPEEIKQLEKHLNDIGVTLVRPKYEKLSYECGLAPGKPGIVCISQGASYSAWLHEVKHADDDYADGWLGLRVFQDPQKCAKREIDAYQLEIDLAKALGLDDIVKRLEKLRDEEIRKYEQYAGTDRKNV